MAANNLIKRFAQNSTGTNLLTDGEYDADAQRLIGNQPGVARASLVNKALRGSTLLAAALAEFLANTNATQIDDSMTPEYLASLIHSTITAMIGGVAPPAGYETPGLVAYFPKSTPPTNWLRCNGANVSRTSYANLFGAIGTLFGAGDGVTTFTLPDLRGDFIRSWDDGRGVDSGRSVGSRQKATIVALDSISTSADVNCMRGTIATAGGDQIWVGDYAGITGTFYEAPTREYSISTSPDERMGTRPVNVALLACIKI